MDSKDQSHKLVLSEASIEIINPSHIHPFVPRYNLYKTHHRIVQLCILCREECLNSYFCEACNFHLCPTCVNKNPLSVDPGKTHEHPLSFVPKFSFVFTLSISSDQHGFDYCICCERTITGFYYESNYKRIHVLCASFQDGYIHVSHPHSELVVLEKSSSAVCSNCKRKGRFWDGYFMMGCIECKDFSLCFRCLTLPKVVEHKYDKNPLSLCYCESFSDGCRCDICKKSLDPTKWYYTSREGNATLHTRCVLGKDIVHRVGSILKRSDMEFEVVHNNNVTQPSCHTCSSRCQGPTLFKFKDLTFCSSKCVKCKWACRVCRTYVSGKYGIYSCPGCKGYNLLGKG